MRKPSRKGELEATQQTVRFFEALLRASADGIVITDATNTVVMVNDAFCAFFGQPWRGVVETSLFTWLEQFDTHSLDRWAELQKCVHVEGSCSNVEFQMTTKNGVKHFNVNASLLERIADEESGVIISIWRDITDLKRAEEALRRANEELEKRVEERTSELVFSNEKLRQEIKERERIEKILRKREKELASESLHLEDVNTALKILLQQREQDKRDLEESILSNVRFLVMPYIERLHQSRLNSHQMTCLETLQANLNQIVSPFLKTLTSKFLGLTPLEIKIASMVKEGKTTKEIAPILYLSMNTVSSYRYRLRCKLGLKNTKTNLHSYLQSLSE
jgi:PAS domain S-box-containing protein